MAVNEISNNFWRNIESLKINNSIYCDIFVICSSSDEQKTKTMKGKTLSNKREKQSTKVNSLKSSKQKKVKFDSKSMAAISKSLKRSPKVRQFLLLFSNVNLL